MESIQEAASESASSTIGGSRVADQARADYLTCVAVLVFYQVDALLLLLLGLSGAGRLSAALWFSLTGLIVAGGGALLIRRYGAGRLEHPGLVIVQAGVALTLVLCVASANPELMTLMLMTVIVIIPTAALRIPPMGLIVICAITAAASMYVVLSNGGKLSMPADNVVQQVLSGIFLLWTLAKGASLNMAGMQLRMQLDESHSRLVSALARVEELATRDELTGLPNRRHMLSVLDSERERFGRDGFGYAVAMLDIDNFKRVNDQHGHPVGDEVIRCVARIATDMLRKPDIVGRVGGEEFLIILPGAARSADAIRIAERVRMAIENHDWAGSAADLQVTVSLGVAVGLASDTSESIIARADRGLYAAKHSGRNRVCTGVQSTAEASGPGLPSVER